MGMPNKERRKPTDWKEARRLRAWELAQKEWKQCTIAEALGVSEGAVSQWLKRGRAGGVEALYSQPLAGPAKRLSDEERAQLPALLEKGAEHFGFRGDVWTRPRVAELIEREFDVSYSPRHVGRILQELGCAQRAPRQKPVHRASQRDEERITRWQEETWPDLKKKPHAKGVRSSS
jgi:transposase